MLEDKKEMVKYFVSDSRELLDDAEPRIIEMEEKAVSSGEIDEEIINTIFRLFHSLKGSASFLDLQTIISVTHEAETLLDYFRKGEAAVKPEHVDLLIRTTDFIRNILDKVEQQLNDKGFEPEAQAIVGDLKNMINFIAQSEEDTAKKAEADEASQNEDKEEELEFTITADMDRQFISENMELLDETEKALLALERVPDNLEFANKAFRSLHSFKGNAGFWGYSELVELSQHAESLLERIRSGEKNTDSVQVSFLLLTVDALRDAINQVNDGKFTGVADKQELINYLDQIGLEDSQNVVKSTKDVPDSGTEKQVKNKAAREKQNSSGQQSIRVDTEKIDKLLDLVGELVIAEAMVINEREVKDRQNSRFERAILQFDKITRDIQEIAMAMRMVPLTGTFRKMVRLVRDLAQKENKNINLEISGEETEVDKTIIEKISDPLVHLIRNSVDHGIESPEERVAGGKPEKGNIHIEAKHTAGEVWIIVEDDGRGLNREKIFQKGVERGLIRETDRDLKDEEVWKLIFEPGFSTAEKVSSISGRGVGMDVVKQNIEKLRGKVDLRSKPGMGTMFIIRIPLTLAIIEGMVVKVGQNRYIIPISSIKESLQPKEQQITLTPDNLEVVRIRGEMLPVIRLHELYRIPSAKKLTEGILVVVESDDIRCCLFADEVVGQQQIVVKGLPGYLGHVKSISGCAILGDGDISMILDIAELISMVAGK